MNKKEWQEQRGFDDETMAKISVFVPKGKIISITPIKSLTESNYYDNLHNRKDKKI